MPTQEELYTALRNADKAGDTEGARKIAAFIQSQASTSPAAAVEKVIMRPQVKESAGKSAGVGALLGLTDMGNTVINAAVKLPGMAIPELAQWNRTRNADREALADERSNSLAFQGARIGGNVVSTLPVGPALATGVRAVAPGAVGLANAVATGGMRAGATPGTLNMLTRMAGGAITGGATGYLVQGNAEGAGMGAGIGAFLPPALAGLGKVGSIIGSKLAGPVIAPEMRQAAQAARNVGYVIPPTQVKPTLANRALEGFAGKLTTAQNASAKNQPITNELARRAIGAADLSEAGIANVRAQANRAYDALGQVGKFQADAGFTQALDDAASMSAAMRENFPELVNSKVDDLITGLKSRPEFDAQPTIEAIKQFRADSATNKIALDPAQKALGKAQAKIAAALEDMIERNLRASGNPQLLEGFRAARQTLAKTHQVEKALNRTTGNVDGNTLAQIMQKGKPMTGDLRTIADFAARFPKASQTVERMGSLPGVSPLDFAATAISGATANPLYMAGVLGRPMARAAALSGPIQNNLARVGGPGPLTRLLANDATEQLIYRSAPGVAGGGAR